MITPRLLRIWLLTLGLLVKQPALAADAGPAKNPSQPRASEPELAALIAALRDRVANRANRVSLEETLQKLAGFGPDATAAVPALVSMLKGKEADLRLNGANGLRAVGPGAKEAIPVLQALVEADADQRVRNTAAEALKALEPARYGDAAAKHQIQGVWTQARRPPGVQSASPDEPLTLVFLGGGLTIKQGKQQPPWKTVYELYPGLQPKWLDIWTMDQPMTAIYEITGDTLKVLGQVGERPRQFPRPNGGGTAQIDSLLKRGMGAQIETAGDSGSPSTLVQKLRDKDAAVRCAAAIALGRLGPKARVAIPDLIGAFEDVQEEVALEAGLALGKIGVEAVGALTTALEQGSIRRRKWAAYALGEAGPPEPTTLQALTRNLGDADSRVRISAAGALETFGPAAKLAFPALLEAYRKASAVKGGQVEGEVIPSLVSALARIDLEAARKEVPGLRYNGGPVVWVDRKQ